MPSREHAEAEGDGAAEAAAGDQTPERGGAVGRERVQARSPTEASRRTSDCTAASVPTNRAASTQSASAPSAGESSSSAPGRSWASIRSRAARGERVARAAGEQRDIGPGQRSEPQVHLGDDPEAAEAADLELGEVVPGDVLHHPPAGLHQSAVAGGDGAAEDVVAHRSEAVAQRARGGGRDDRAEAALRPARRIEREPHALVGEPAAERFHRRARLHGGDEVGRADRERPDRARGC